MKKTLRTILFALVITVALSFSLTSCKWILPDNNQKENPSDNPTDNPNDNPTDDPTDDPESVPPLDAEWASDFTVSRVFSDDMVVQRGEYIRVWGFADESQNGKKVAGSFKGVTAEALIENGEWCLTFKKLFEADVNPTEMKLYTDNKEIVFRGVLVGDVYMAIGQSNMEYQVFKHIEGTDAATQGGGLDAIDENSIIRLNNANPVTTAGVSYPAGDQPSKDLYRETQWTKTTVEDTLEFSALGYYFAKEIVEKTEGKIPVGVIEIGFGGAPIKLLMPNQVYEASGYGTTGSKGYIYNRHIAPFERYAIAGLIWYQGESNNSFEEAPLYTERLSALVEYMRGTHNLVNKDFPVFAVEFPSIYKKPADATDWRYMELGMIRSYLGNLPKVLDNSYIAVSCDVWKDRTFWNNLHPHCKYEQANRVADLASYVVYGQGEFSDVTGPILNKIEISADGLSAVLTFDNVGEGLKTVDGGNAVDGIVVFLADQYSLKYETPMSAEITAYNQITVTNGKKICGVAYNYESENYYGEEVNLCNSAGCPASAFNTGFTTKEPGTFTAEGFIEASDSIAQKKRFNIDLLKADGTNVFTEGGVTSNLDAAGNKITVSEGTATLNVSGWTGFGYEIELFGYSIDGGDAVLNFIPKSPEQAVINAAGEYAKRYSIDADFSGLKVGKHTVSFLALLNIDGTEKVVKLITIEVIYGHGDGTVCGPFDAVKDTTNKVYADDVVIGGSSGVTTSTHYIKNSANATNDRGVGCIGDIGSSGGVQYIIFNIDSTKSETVALYMEFGMYSTASKFSDWATIIVNEGTANEKKYTFDADMPVGTNWKASNKFVLLGDIALVEGANTIKLNIISATGSRNVYGVKFLTESAVITWKSASDDTDVDNPTEDTREDANWNESEIFYAVNSDGQLESAVELSSKLNIETTEVKLSNGHGCIGNLNTNKGEYITFFINSSEAARVGLYAEFTGGSNTSTKLSDWADLIVNDTTYASEATMPAGTAWRPTNPAEYVFLGFVELKEGDNTITFKVNTASSIARNIYGIKFTSESAEISWTEFADITVIYLDENGDEFANGVINCLKGDEYSFTPPNFLYLGLEATENTISGTASEDTTIYVNYQKADTQNLSDANLYTVNGDIIEHGVTVKTFLDGSPVQADHYGTSFKRYIGSKYGAYKGDFTISVYLNTEFTKIGTASTDKTARLYVSDYENESAYWMFNFIYTKSQSANTSVIGDSTATFESTIPNDAVAIALMKNSDVYLTITRSENVLTWEAVIKGGEGTGYEGQTYSTKCVLDSVTTEVVQLALSHRGFAEYTVYGIKSDSTPFVPTEREIDFDTDNGVIDGLLAERELPNVMEMQDGTAVTLENVDAWREEAIDLLLNNIYGTMPDYSDKEIKYEVLESKTVNYVFYDSEGISGIESTIRITLDCDLGEWSFDVVQVVPVNVEKCPIVVMLNFRKPVPDRQIPIAQILKAGCGIVRIYYQDIASDSSTVDGIETMYNEGDYTWGTIAMWAFSAMRVMDYLQEQSFVDTSKIAVIGHSRLGKTALLTAALDTRFTHCFANNSGCSGDALSRGKTGEDIKAITNMCPWWFCDKYKEYADNEAALPIDQHYLLALIAPRNLAIGAASEDATADPTGQYLSACAATPMWELYGELGMVHPDSLPEIGDYYSQGKIEFHYRCGDHYLNEYDWACYLSFLLED